ncbi:MAG: DUF4419 domain-containing protein [Salinivirgaceae bacterium]|nr:DUF4419 domain-containing protein [Salinivirgaceae bacterium]
MKSLKMKTTFFLLLFGLTTLSVSAKDKIISRTDSSITFVVDGKLPRVPMDYPIYDGDKIAQNILTEDSESQSDFYLDSQPNSHSNKVRRLVATSFADEQNIVDFQRKDIFYSSIVFAFSNHNSLVLSPDMVWLAICQGFSRYVNAHPEQLRDLIVNHSDKKTLSLMVESDLLSDDTDWSKLIDGFMNVIAKNTKSDIAQTIVSDFSTTGQTERIASQITLMETVKPYFDYEAFYMVCGIPTITLQGTPHDWQMVYDKAMKLKQFCLEPWINELEPILSEFVRAAQENPDRNFWQRIVKERTSKMIRGCSREPQKTDTYEGWFLKFFPDENGNTYSRVLTNESMPVDKVCVEFNYIIANSAKTDTIRMELRAGFIGAQVDTDNAIVTPKIGWIVSAFE